MSVTMEQLLFLQDDLCSRITKTRTNYKKMSKDRKTKDLIQSKLDSLEKLWSQFVETHTELCKTSDPKLLISSLYMTKDVYETTEELYVDCKCLLKKDLPDEQWADSESQADFASKTPCKTNSYAKLPKIVIPKFSGDYTEWSTFRDLYKSLVHDTDMDKAVKSNISKVYWVGKQNSL